MRQFPAFAAMACSRYGLPNLAPTVREAEGPTQGTRRNNEKVTYTLENVPRTHTISEESFDFLQWVSSRGHFAIISDCKPLVEVAMGLCPLADSSLLPVFQRLTSNLSSLLLGGLKPPHQSADPVLWRSRQHNRIADHLVNVTMDLKESWEQLFLPSENVTNHNFVMHCDGGTRAGKCSAAAWVLEAQSTTESGTEVLLLARKGIFIADPVSSFTAELLALESCTEALARFWKKLTDLS